MPKSKLAQKFAVFMAVMAGLVYVAIFATMAVEGKLEDFSLEAFQSLDGLMKVGIVLLHSCYAAQNNRSHLA